MVSYMGSQCKTQTADWGPGINCRLIVKYRLKTRGKMQIEDKVQTKDKG